jgi:putative hemolysin
MDAAHHLHTDAAAQRQQSIFPRPPVDCPGVEALNPRRTHATSPPLITHQARCCARIEKPDGGKSFIFVVVVAFLEV